MILVDTSVWVDHLRVDEPALRQLLEQGDVLAHPWVIGELALGSLQQRSQVLGLLGRLPFAEVSTASEMLGVIERYQLAGVGVGYVDVQLLAATLLTPGAQLWTRDKRLAKASEMVGLTPPEAAVQDR